MKNSFRSETCWMALALLALFATAALVRPLLPIDETRYLTVAWEMYLRHDWLAPLTVNFAPYHHKPPMLFWLINAAWSVFGVSRWAALIPVFIASAVNLWLVRELAKDLFPKNPEIAERAPVLMLGSIFFLVYGTLMMFDIMLTSFVLGFFVCMFRYVEARRIAWALAAGLALGFGVLTKGPVAYLYVIFPMLFGRFWARKGQAPGWKFALVSIVVSVLPVLFWLVPVLKQSDGDFAFWLVWEQTAGRVTGNFSSSHARPIYFYLPFLPAIFLPWIFFPAFWTNARSIKSQLASSSGLRFLMIWFVPVFVSFSLISGKQPHYMVPLLPACVVLAAWLLQKADGKLVARITAVFVWLFVAGQIMVDETVLKPYELTPIANYVREHHDKDWAFVRNYNGEIGFLARMEKPVENTDLPGVAKWFSKHPHGMAVIRYKTPDEVAMYEMIMTMKYRGKNLGVFKKK